MKLTIGERLLCLEILPKEGSFITLKLTRQAIEELTFDEQEIKESKLIQGENGRITWEPNKDPNKDVKLNDIVSDLIKKELIDLNKKEKLTPQYMSLYEKFIDPKPE
jgi:hypothetical protein